MTTQINKNDTIGATKFFFYILFFFKYIAFTEHDNIIILYFLSYGVNTDFDFSVEITHKIKYHSVMMSQFTEMKSNEYQKGRHS